MEAYHVIKTIAMTEKSNELSSAMKYTFIVDPRADKLQIKRAVETLFSRKVASVNVMYRLGKSRRTRYGAGKRPDLKKAIVTLKAGEEPIAFS